MEDNKKLIDIENELKLTLSYDFVVNRNKPISSMQIFIAENKEKYIMENKKIDIEKIYKDWKEMSKIDKQIYKIKFDKYKLIYMKKEINENKNIESIENKEIKEIDSKRKKIKNLEKKKRKCFSKIKNEKLTKKKIK